MSPSPVRSALKRTPDFNYFFIMFYVLHHYALAPHIISGLSHSVGANCQFNNCVFRGGLGFGYLKCVIDPCCLFLFTSWQVKINKIGTALEKTLVTTPNVSNTIICLGTCAGNKISVDSVPCDPVRSNHRDHKCGECCWPDPKYTNSNLTMIFPKFSMKKSKIRNLVQLV